MDEGGTLVVTTGLEEQAFLPFTEPIQLRSPVLGAVEPAHRAATDMPFLLRDLYCARAEHPKPLRRLAGELLPECLCLSADEQASALAGASMMVRGRAGDRSNFNAANITREAAQLFSRLPDDTKDALIVLKLLAKFVSFIEDGLADVSGLEPAGMRRLQGSVATGERPMRGHLKLVNPD